MSASTQLNAIAPQFDTADDRATFLSNAALQTDSAYYGSNADLAIALLAAHELTMRSIAEASGAGGGEISGKREGDLSITYHKSDTSSGALGKTSYGIWLQGLRCSSNISVAVTGGNDDGS